MSSNQNITTNFKDSNGVDLGSKLVRKDYLLSVYPSIGQQIGIPPELWCWGFGNNGNLGNSAITDRITPVTTFAGGTNWKQVSAGGFHTAAIKTDGTLWVWGSGSGGRLGNATITDTSTPVTTFSGGTNWKQVSAGVNYTAAIKTDGTLWTWGYGDNGKLGANDITNRSTPVTTFAGGTNWKQVSLGTIHVTAIKTDGTLWTWGYGGNGRLGRFAIGTNKVTPVTTFAGGINWKDVPSSEPEDLYTISAGGFHTAAIKTDGTLWTWGYGNNGRLGNGATTGTFSTPVTTFAGGTNWKQVSAGGYYTAVVKTDGTLWTWGYGGFGQLGNAQTTNRSTPVTTFSGGTNWKQVSAGVNYTAAIKTDGTLWTWGLGSNGRLGNGATTGTFSTPVTTFAGGTNWKQVSCGTAISASNFSTHTAAIKTDGTLWTWGSNSLFSSPFGQLGNAQTTNRSTPVTTFAGGTNWKQVSAGGSFTAAIKTDGTLWTWGYGGFGQLGNAQTTNRSTPVTTFAGGTNWKQVSAGGFHTAAIKTDGTLWTWGYGNNGRLGTNDITNRSTPVTTFAGGTNWKQVSCGRDHTISLYDDGVNKELYLFGINLNGQLGSGLDSIDWVPNETFAGGTNWKQVSAGNEHTAAIKTDGTLWTWGYGNNGRLGTNDITNRSTPVTTFAGGTNWKQVSAGNQHTSVVKTDGTLWTWGFGNNGNLGNAQTTNISTPVTTFSGGTNWKQVSAGGFHTAAIKTDGTLWTWGEGTNGRLGNANNISRITPVTTFAGGNNWKQVSAGNAHTTAIQSVDFVSF
jgi:alpha-tubulin suppressor-like RCC1 family protein